MKKISFQLNGPPDGLDLARMREDLVYGLIAAFRVPAETIGKSAVARVTDQLITAKAINDYIEHHHEECCGK